MTLRGLTRATRVALQPLDGRGQPWGEPREAARTSDGHMLELSSEPGTTWYLVEVERR